MNDVQQHRSRFAKAQELGITRWDESQFLSELQRAGIKEWGIG